MTFNTKVFIVLGCISYGLCFKPYYKWMTFNTEEEKNNTKAVTTTSFKPYYKWMTFNTKLVYKFLRNLHNVF